MKSKEEMYAEIESLKEVNLVDFICALYGFYPDLDKIKKENGLTPNPKYIFLQNDSGEKILVSRLHKEGRQQFVYKNLYNDLDHGNILSFIKQRSENYSVPSAKKQIYDFQKKLNHEYQSQGYAIELSSEDLQSNTDSKLRKIQAEYQVLPAFTHQEYLIGRGLNPTLLNSYLCKNRIKNEYIYYPKISSSTKQQIKFINTVFPIYGSDREKTFLCGFVKKNTNLKMTAEDSMYSLGIWSSDYRRNEPVTKLIICENPIDALSYCQMHIDLTVDNPMLTATNGEITKTQLQLYQEIVERLKPQKILLGNDFNCRGQVFNAKLLSNLSPLDSIPTLENLTLDVGYKNKHTGEIIYKFSHPEGINDNNGKELITHLPQFVKFFNYYNTKNSELYLINDEHYPFKIEKTFKINSSELSISFHNSTANWIEINKSIIDLKFQKSEWIQLIVSNAVDWNQDLQNSLLAKQNNELKSGSKENI